MDLKNTAIVNEEEIIELIGKVKQLDDKETILMYGITQGMKMQKDILYNNKWNALIEKCDRNGVEPEEVILLTEALIKAKTK